jgi:hypothetical protein
LKFVYDIILVSVMFAIFVIRKFGKHILLRIQVSGLQRESLELELERGGGQPDLLACLVVHNLIRRALEVRGGHAHVWTWVLLVNVNLKQKLHIATLIFPYKKKHSGKLQLPLSRS